MKALHVSYLGFDGSNGDTDQYRYSAVISRRQHPGRLGKAKIRVKKIGLKERIYERIGLRELNTTVFSINNLGLSSLNHKLHIICIIPFLMS